MIIRNRKVKEMRGLQAKKELAFICFLSIVIGVAVGAVDTLFGKVLLFVTELRQEHFIYLIPFLAPAGMIFTYFFIKYGKTSAKGMGLIFQVGQKEEQLIPKRLTPFIIIGTWLTHLFGGSAGREGVAVQLGAAIAHQIGGFFKKIESSQFIIIGMAAGFAGLFETPIAATFFAIEVLVIGHLRYDVFLPTLFAAFTASFTSKALGLEGFTFDLEVPVNLDVVLFCKLIILGLLFGLVGRLFSTSLKDAKAFFNQKFPNAIRRIGIIGLLLSLLLALFFQGRYSGLGTNLIVASFQGGTIEIYDWLLKLIFTILTISIGFQGGEVTPSFAIGASLGAVLATTFGLPGAFVAALGYVSVFGSATNTLLAPIFIGGEVFGFEYLPYFVIVAGVAFIFNGNFSIYGNQKIK